MPYKCVCSRGEKRQRARRDGSIELDDKQAEVAHKAGVDGQTDFASIFEHVLGFIGLFIGA
jgi:hypothetical protein